MFKPNYQINEFTGYSVSKYVFTGMRSFILFLFLFFSASAKADYTVASGSTINASTLTGQSGTLLIQGTLLINSNVSLSNFTTVIIDGANGQIFWQNNSDLTFSASVSMSITNGAPGLQPTGGNASKRLIIGTTVIAVSNDNSSNAAFSFEEFNEAGGLPQFLLSVSTTTVCSGTAFTATITPLNNTINYDCSWTISGAGTRSPSTHSNFNTARTTTITPTGSGTYTVSCTMYQAGDGDPIATKTRTVTVNTVPATPTATTASPGTICQGASANIKATSAGNTIRWYTVSSGGTSIGSRASNTNYAVSPASTTTYYAEAQIAASGCASINRSSVTVTVNPTSAGGSITGGTTVCSGTNSTTLTLSGYTGSITRWEYSGDNFVTAPIVVANTTNTLTITNLTTTRYYRAVVTSGICSSAYSTVATIAVSSPGTWLGINTDWNSTLNWCNGTIPTASTNVTIPNGLNFYPVINTTAWVNNVTVATGGSANIMVTGVFKIAGTITSTNDIDATNGTIELIGSAAQTISADNFVSATVTNLSITNTLSSASAVNPSVTINTAGGMLKVSTAVSFGNVNNAWLNTNDNLTLLSSAAATAAVTDITNNSVNTGNNITGKVVVERYIPGRRAWRLLTAPVTIASQVKISDSWQEGAAPVTNASIINASNNPNPGYGTHITFGNPATNGFDQGVNGNASIYYLTPTGWNGVPTATNNGAALNSGYITDQPGYMVFVRGDRSTPLSQATSAATTPTVLRIKGNINSGPGSLALNTGMVSGSSNFRLVSNPYPSAVNFHKIMGNSANSAAGFADAFYLWDPNITGNNSVGGWVALSYNSSTGLYDRNVSASSVNNTGDIQSGAAFMIDYTGSAGSLQVQEPNKASGSNNSQFRPAPLANNQVRVSLMAKNADDSISENDGLLVTYGELYSNEVDKMDMKKLFNFSENIALKVNNEALVIERRKIFVKTDTLHFQLSKMRQKNYQLQIDLHELAVPQGTVALLEDKFTREKKAFVVGDKAVYDFAVNANTASSQADRFTMVFKPVVDFQYVKATLDKNDAFIEWSLPEEFNISGYEVERSIDGNSFVPVSKVIAVGGSDKGILYSAVDAKPAAGEYVYRIKAMGKNGVFVYSDKVNLTVINPAKGVFVFPNPVTGSNINLQMNDMIKGRYAFTLVSTEGRQVTTGVVNYNGGSSTNTIALPANTPAGTYLLTLSGSDGNTVSVKVFVKGN